MYILICCSDKNGSRLNSTAAPSTAMDTESEGSYSSASLGYGYGYGDAFFVAKFVFGLIGCAAFLF